MFNRYVQPLRGLIQVGFLLLSLLIGFQFARFVSALFSGGPLPFRPAAIEAFLPISGLYGAIAWLKGGGINPVHPGSGGDLCHHRRHCPVAAARLLFLDLSDRHHPPSGSGNWGSAS
ncbi:MAG: hypothetical protein MZW92_37605 [Comamonadaceae bacterium]|nr:hypothetical protein [Comamonadaceae bacterium]